MDKSALMWEWSLVSGPANATVDPSTFGVKGSRLYIPKGRLYPGSYVLNIRAYLSEDPSKFTRSTYTIMVKSRPLVADIHGGSSITASTTRDLVLDASGSRDPDWDAPHYNLHFSWICTMMSRQGLVESCHFKTGLPIDPVLPKVPVLTIPKAMVQAMHPTGSAAPYVFQVTVRKESKMPVSYQMPGKFSHAHAWFLKQQFAVPENCCSRR